MPAIQRPQVGDKAPAFSLPALPDGKNVELSDFKGKHVVLYFYPKDMTPGCTTESCDFRDAHARLSNSGAVVLGVSPDSVEDHKKFAAKYELPFPLLADEDHAVAEKYGAWVEKNMYGKKSWGVQRSTFLIDRDGTIAHVWPRVRVDGHVAAVAQKLEELA
ncbi:MAG: thioredoxin-dependent thiol peroxidase [Planctomycetota bacterium]|nr:thioredoxin-dependent thiol peroxidase [Planctomycetaceae bacterium]MDQ3330115.1 thioredoxin-dependent thiol peroxidase [Planctomycetota bacterium]